MCYPEILPEKNQETFALCLKVKQRPEFFKTRPSNAIVVLNSTGTQQICIFLTCLKKNKIHKLFSLPLSNLTKSNFERDQE